MLDKFITPIIKPMLNTVVAVLHKRGVTADQLTMMGFLVGMLALPLIAFEFWYGALAAIAVNRIFDGLDGALARHANQSSSAGGYLDITLDFLFYAAVPLGFILANPEQNAIAGALLLAAFIGTGSSFLAFAIAAEKFQLDKPQFKYKSFYYLNGLTEKYRNHCPVCRLMSLATALRTTCQHLCRCLCSYDFDTHLWWLPHTKSTRK